MIKFKLYILSNICYMRGIIFNIEQYRPSYMIINKYSDFQNKLVLFIIDSPLNYLI